MMSQLYKKLNLLLKATGNRTQTPLSYCIFTEGLDSVVVQMLASNWFDFDFTEASDEI